MNRKLLAPLVAAAVVGAASAASASNTSVYACDGFFIGISDDIAVQAELRTGSQEAARQLVCETAEQLDEVQRGLEIPTSILVHLMPGDIHTRVVYIPDDDDD